MAAMCGIGAILDPAGTASADAGPRMTAALRHRGPDGEAVRRHRARDAGVRAAGDHRRGRRRPAAVLRGRVRDRHRERGDLQPPRAACRAGGAAATPSPPTPTARSWSTATSSTARASSRRLNGMFGAAVWDARRERLVAARDPFGVKPVYWWSDGRRVALASEVGALLAAGLVAAARRPDGPRPLPGLPVRAGAADDVRGRVQAAAGVRSRGRAQRRPEDPQLPPGTRASRWPGSAARSWPRSCPGASWTRSSGR